MGMDKALCFVDTGILVAAFDRLERDKHETAARLLASLWQSRTGVVSTQVLEEFHTLILRSKGLGVSLKSSQEIIEAFSYWQVFTPKPNDLLQAISLQEKYLLSFYDALIIQSALVCRCGLIYSEQLMHGLKAEGTRIVNPFLEV